MVLWGHGAICCHGVVLHGSGRGGWVGRSAPRDNSFTLMRDGRVKRELNVAGGESVKVGIHFNLSPSDVFVGSDGKKTKNKKPTSLRSFLSLQRKYFD